MKRRAKKDWLSYPGRENIGGLPFLIWLWVIFLVWGRVFYLLVAG